MKSNKLTPKHPSPSTLPPAAAAVAAVDTAGTPTLPTAADAAEVVDTARATTLPTAAAEAPHSNPPIDSAQRRRKISNYSNTKAYNCNLSVHKSIFAELGIKLKSKPRHIKISAAPPLHGWVSKTCKKTNGTMAVHHISTARWPAHIYMNGTKASHHISTARWPTCTVKSFC